jgi:hypothetical protein
MSKESVEVIHGRRSKFEIYKVSKSFGGVEFIIHKDGSYWKGVYDSLAAAVKKAQSEG